MDEWKIITLEQAGVMLFDCVHETPKAVESGYPYVTIPQMKDGRINFLNARKISYCDFLKWTKKARPQLHDVVLSRRTNPGVTATFGSRCDFALGQNLVLLRANGTTIVPEFLRWLVVSPAWWGQIKKFNNVGAVFDSLRCADILRFELPIPPIYYQSAVSSILGVLDDKIELNRRTNATLEAMARALFKSWFVDFNPVRAKAEGRAPAHMDAATAALFPDRFDDTGLPEGWRPGTLPDVVEINPRERLSQGTAAPYIDMKALPTSGSRTHPPITRAFGSGSKFRNGDTLLARITPCLENGKTALVDTLEAGQIGWGSTEFIVLRPRASLPPVYAYALARSEDFRNHAIKSMSGTSGRQRVQPDAVARFEVAVPDDRIGRAFGDLTEPWIDLIKSNSEQSATLATFRDTLLPKLMSGELRVREAEKALADAPL